MSAILAATTFVFVTTLSPGPNNFIVMHAAAKGGPRAALAPILGVVLGGLIMLILLQLGLLHWLQDHPERQQWLQYAGAALLSWIAWGLATAPPPSDPETQTHGRNGFVGMTLFQCLNPKTWLGAATAVSLLSRNAADNQNPAVLVLLYTLIPMINLSLWAGLGNRLTRHLKNTRFRRCFQIGSGLLLFGFALLILPELSDSGG